MREGWREKGASHSVRAGRRGAGTRPTRSVAQCDASISTSCSVTPCRTLQLSLSLSLSLPLSLSLSLSFSISLSHHYSVSRPGKVRVVVVVASATATWQWPVFNEICVVCFTMYDLLQRWMFAAMSDESINLTKARAIREKSDDIEVIVMKIVVDVLNLAGWLAGRLAGWPAGWLAGWQAGRQADRQAVPPPASGHDRDRCGD